MWFKQIQVFQLSNVTHWDNTTILEKLEPLLFKPCFPSMPKTAGWVSPIDEDEAPLIRSVNGYTMFCMQVEEKILPAAVIRQELEEKLKRIESIENRKIYQREKLTLKDELIMTLLPKAFSKLTRVYGYINTKQQQLVLGTANVKLAEQFLSLFKKSFNVEVTVIDLKNLSSTLTLWLKRQNYPSSFSIEKQCVLRDPEQKNRIVRCQQQDLFTNSMQSLLKEGYEVIQLALSWQDRVKFVLANDFSLRSLNFEEEIVGQVKEMEPETKQQQLDADFLIMSETLTHLLTDLQSAFSVEEIPIQAVA